MTRYYGNFWRTCALGALLATGCGDHQSMADAGDATMPDACTACRSTCEAAGCRPDQRCEPGVGEALACVFETCEPGFEWVDGGCSPVEGATCGGDGALAIASACGRLHRGCADDDGGARCGECDPGYVPAGSLCVEGAECSAAGCASMGRSCLYLGGVASCGACNAGYSDVEGACLPTSCETCASEHRSCDASGDAAICGGCASGYEVSGGLCVAGECAALGCSGKHRTCSVTPAPHCDEACEDGWVWDDASLACRAPKTCADLPCDAADSCIEASGTQDAVCGCSLTEGWDSQKDGVGGCRPCGPGGIKSASSCTNEGEEGQLVNADGIDGGACFCMTKDGYFPGTNNRAQACDIDGDGWMNSAARVVLEDTRPNVVENGRCDLRRVSSFELRPEVGDATTVPLDAPLPLYESPRNDGASSEDHGDYGHSAPTQLAPRYLNSLTKACVAPEGDYNDDDVLDVTEAQDMEPGSAIVPGLRAYYAQYVRFTYFLELHDGWYVPGDAVGEPGIYVIEERSRLDSVPSRGVGLQHSSPDAYWRSCQRHDDLLYSVDPASLVGADFVGGSMHHHSQFKCVVGSSLAEYGSSTANVRPWSVFSNGGAKVAWLEGGTLIDLGQSNACDLTGESYQADDGPAVNPQFPGVSCEVADLDTSGTMAQWVVVNYLNAGLSEYEAADPEYRRGCINECAELGVDACPTYVPGAGDGFVCDMSTADGFGKIVCGCGDDFSGPATSCALGCPNNGSMTQHFVQSDFEIFHRTGYWACIDPMVSSSSDAEGGGYTLRGGVPRAAVSGGELTGDGYSVTGRIRPQVHAVP